MLFLAVLALNGVQLWLASPKLAQALAGTAGGRPAPAFVPDGESNIIPFPARPAAHVPTGPGSSLSSARTRGLRAA
ncbi:MAG: hypothetical protein ACRC1J_11875 [Sandaracinobacteroides sp.]